MNQLFTKLFLGGEWAVAIRRKNYDSYIVLEENNKEYWLADPFVYKYCKDYYLFTEAYIRKTNKGVIRSFYINDDLSITDLGTVIEQPYHMSYPHIFEIGNEIYMIPETSGNRTIELYKCVEFPQKWKKIKNLKEDIYAVDSNIVRVGEDVFLITYTFNSTIPILEVYMFDEKTLSISPYSEEPYVVNNGRGAGNLIINGNQIIRPAQNQMNKYGESIFFKKCHFIGKFSETIESELKISDVNIKGKENYKRIHTYNTADDIEVIDVRTEKIELLLPWKKVKRYIYNNINK